MKKLFTLFALLSALFLGATNSYAFKGESADYHPVIESANVKGKGFSIIFPKRFYYRDVNKSALVIVSDNSVVSYVLSGNKVTVELVNGKTVQFTHESEEIALKFYQDLGFMLDN